VPLGVVQLNWIDQANCVGKSVKIDSVESTNQVDKWQGLASTTT